MVTSASTLSSAMSLPPRGRERDLRADLGHAAGVDDHVDGQVDEHAARPPTADRAAVASTGAGARSSPSSRRLARPVCEGGLGAPGQDVGDRRDLHAGNPCTWATKPMPIWPAPTSPTRTGRPSLLLGRRGVRCQLTSAPVWVLDRRPRHENCCRDAGSAAWSSEDRRHRQAVACSAR